METQEDHVLTYEMSPADKDVIFASTYLYDSNAEDNTASHLPESMSIDDGPTAMEIDSLPLPYPCQSPSPTISPAQAAVPAVMTPSPMVISHVPSDTLKRKERPSMSMLKLAKLSQWFSPVSEDVAKRD